MPKRMLSSDSEGAEEGPRSINGERKDDKINQGSSKASKEPPRGSQEGPEDNPSEPPGVSKHLPGVAQGTPKVRKTAQELSQYGGNRPKQ